MAIPQHVRIESYIREDEEQLRPEVFPVRAAQVNAIRVCGLVEITEAVFDPRAVEIALYMYARRAAHWGLYAMGERGPDLLATYYRRA